MCQALTARLHWLCACICECARQRRLSSIFVALGGCCPWRMGWQARQANQSTGNAQNMYAPHIATLPRKTQRCARRHTHTNTHTYTHTIHTQIHTQYTQIHTNTHPRTHARTHARARARTHAHALTCAHRRITCSACLQSSFRAYKFTQAISAHSLMDLVNYECFARP